MSTTPDILCIGSVLWDVIGCSARPMGHGADVPGRILRQPGGVAMNIAMTLVPLGLTPALLTAIGEDADGDELMARAQDLGLVTDHVFRSPEHRTDLYMAVEDTQGLVAAVADAHSLEAAGAAILSPLDDGRLGSIHAPYPGLIALDGNLTEALLSQIAQSGLFSKADLRVAPASPGKATRLRPLLGHPRATFYVNIEEAGLICGTRFSSARTAAAAMVQAGAARAMVTAGPDEAADATPEGEIVQIPPKVDVQRITGAGDSFMAAHIAAEHRRADRATALDAALTGAAHHISGG